MSQNDPKWGGGRKNGESPPDLEEMLRGFSQKLARLLGKKGGPPLQFNSRTTRGFKGGVGAIVAIILLLWAASGFYVVDERENAVITRFGRYIETVNKSGLHWHLPMPIEKRKLVNVTEVRSLEVGATHANSSDNEEGTMLTGDQNIIQLQLEIQYNIKSAKDFLFNNRLADRDGRDIVKQTAATSIREVVGRNKVDYVLNEGRGKIAEDTQTMMQSLLDKYGSGVSVTRVNISDVQPPEPVQAAFADAVKARQDKARLVNEGRAYANDVIPKASGMAARLREESEGYRQKIEARAQGDSERFKQVLSEYTKAPQVTRQRLYVETMQQIYSDTTKVVIDQKSGTNLLYLPLDKLLHMAPSQTAASTSATPINPAPSPDNLLLEKNGRSRGLSERGGR